MVLLQLDANNAPDYLSRRGLAVRGPVQPLGGGVSNTVLLVETDRGRVVLKQALGKLRVAADWRSNPIRTLRECVALQQMAQLHEPGDVPFIHFLDRENLIYVMEAAPIVARDWKTLLLGGDIDTGVAERIGALLAKQIRGTWKSAACQSEYGDQTVFDELRLDPYYRYTAQQHPDLAPYYAHLIARCSTYATSLVHGDWSPKNFLVAGGRPMVIDYEVVHFGDASFDAAFLLNHLLLKSLHRPEWRSRLADAATAFWESLSSGLPADASWFAEGAKAHLGGLLLARIDGKSPAEYLHESVKPAARALARHLITAPPGGSPADILENYQL